LFFFSSGYDPPLPHGRTRRTSALVTALPCSSFGPDVHEELSRSFSKNLLLHRGHTITPRGNTHDDIHSFLSFEGFKKQIPTRVAESAKLFYKKSVAVSVLRQRGRVAGGTRGPLMGLLCLNVVSVPRVCPAACFLRPRVCCSVRARRLWTTYHHNIIMKGTPSHPALLKAGPPFPP
jgi:hypothetical protein